MIGTVNSDNFGIRQHRQNNQIAFRGKGNKFLSCIRKQAIDTFSKGSLPGITAAGITAGSGGTFGQAVLNGLIIAFASKIGQDLRQLSQYSNGIKGLKLRKNNLFKRLFR